MNEIDKYISECRNSIYNFYHILFNANLEIEYNYYLLYKYLPFRNTNIDEQKRLIEMYYQTNIYSYSQLLTTIIPLNDEQLYFLNNFLLNNDIYFDAFKYSWKLGNNPNNNWDYNYNLSRIEALLNDYQYPNRKDIIGKTAEIIFHDNYIRTAKDGWVLDWVSKDIGDGFGYDFVMFNEKLNSAHFYEVKGSTTGISNIKLTPNESRVFKKIDTSSYNEIYHVAMVDFQYVEKNIINYDLVDTYYDNNKLYYYSWFNKPYTPIIPVDKYKTMCLLNGKF